MIDIHPTHHGSFTLRDFFIHLAIITLGIFIAIGLEQTVEYFHHLHQRHQLEENLRAELRADIQKAAKDDRRFAAIRAYTFDLKSAVDARRAHKSSPAPPSANDTRRQQVPIAPSIAIWEAAKLDATVTLLPTDEIRLYNGVVLQHTLVFDAINDFQHAAFALESFEERFVDSTGAIDMGYAGPLPSLDKMSDADLVQYQTLLAAYIKSIDRVNVRIHFFASVARGILDGAPDYDQLMRRAFPDGKPPALDLPPENEGTNTP